jgi:tetratricopeptide (TPR) repeat protein
LEKEAESRNSLGDHSENEEQRIMKRVLTGVLVAVTVGFLGLLLYYGVWESHEAKRDRYLKKAQAYITQGKNNEAIIMLKNALQADPGSASARSELGNALLRRQDIRGALSEFRRAIELDPKLVQPRYQLGILYLASHDLGSAKEQLNKIREQNPNTTEARYLAARLWLAEEKPDEALSELQAVLDSPAKKDKSEIAGAYVSIGAIYAMKKDFTAAQDSYRKALGIEPKFLPARVALTGLYIGTQKEAEAEKELLEATKADPENEALLHILGDFYTATQRADDYEKLYREFLKKKPGSLGAKKRMAEIALIKNDPKEAQSYIDDILKTNPADIDGRYFRGRLYQMGGEQQKAVDEFNYVVRSSPQFAPGYYYLALSEFQTRKLPQAKASLAKAAELRPIWIQPRVALAQIYLVTGDYDLAKEEGERMLEMRPNDPQVLLILGDVYIGKGDNIRALEYYGKAQKILPKTAAPYVGLGTGYARQKNYAEAQKALEAALQLDPERLDALSLMTQIYVSQDKYQPAIDRVQQQFGKTKNEPLLYLLLGKLHIGEKDMAKGLEDLQKAVQLKPDLLDAYMLIGNAFATQKKFDYAIEEYQKVIQKEPKAIGAMMSLAAIYDARQEYSKANEYYQKVLDVDRNFALAANNLAWNYAEHGGNLDIALGLAQKARELNSDLPNIADTLGWIYYKKGAYASSVALLKESNEKLQYKNPTILYHLGRAYSGAGEKALAQDAFTKAMKIDPAFPESAETKKALAQLASNK